MAKPSKKEARNGKTEENPEDLERQRLKKIAFRRGILSQSKANPTRPLQPCKPIVKSDGKDIVKKGHRKNKYLFAFPCLVAPVSGGKMGELILLDTKNPILYVDFPQGRLKFFGTIIYPKNKYLTLQFPRASGNIVCEDSFDSMVVFSDVWWIGTEEQNPEELRLDFPKELSQKKHAEFDFKGGAGIVSDHKDSANPKPPSKECDEPITHDTDSESDALQDTEAVKPQSSKSTPNRSKEESKTPVRSSSRTAGKAYKFVDSPSEDDLSSTRSDSSSSDLEEMPKAKKQKVNRNLGNMLEEAAKDSVPILPNSGIDKINEVLASNIQTASTSASKTPSRRKTKASATQSASVATTGTLVQSSLSSFLHQSEEKKSQNEKTPLEAKASTQRRRSTDVKGKAKKNKAADENLSDDEIVEEVQATSKQSGRRKSGRGESASKANQPKAKQKSYDVEELSSGSEVTEPLVKVLRLVDGDESPMAYIYEAMDRAKEAIASFYRHVHSKYGPIWDIIDRRWTFKLHSPLHAAGYYLNHKFFYSSTFHGDYEVMAGLRLCVDRMYPDEEITAKIQTEMHSYKKCEGILFPSPMCIRSRSTMRPGNPH